MRDVVFIANCAEHGLQREPDKCFNCGHRVEQVRRRPIDICPRCDEHDSAPNGLCFDCLTASERVISELDRTAMEAMNFLSDVGRATKCAMQGMAVLNLEDLNHRAIKHYEALVVAV